MNKICLIFPVIVFIVIKFLIICIRQIIRPIIISVLIISCTTIRIMPVMDSSRLHISSPKTAHRIILDIKYEIVPIKQILFLFIFNIVAIPFLFAHLHFKVFKENNINNLYLCQYFFSFLQKIICLCLINSVCNLSPKLYQVHTF